MVSLLEAGLAAWRLAHLLVHEDGPGAALARLRYRAGVRSVVVRRDQADRPVAGRAALTPWAEALTCVWCMSVWTALALSLPARPIGWLRRVLAVSAVAVLAHELAGRLDEEQRR